MNILGFITANSLQAKARTFYSQWTDVARLTDEIIKDPSKAVALSARMHGMANAIRHEIKSYSIETLHYMPLADDPRLTEADFIALANERKRSLWSKFWSNIKLGFSVK